MIARNSKDFRTTRRDVTSEIYPVFKTDNKINSQVSDQYGVFFNSLEMGIVLDALRKSIMINWPKSFKKKVDVLSDFYSMYECEDGMGGAHWAQRVDVFLNKLQEFYNQESIDKEKKATISPIKKLEEMLWTVRGGGNLKFKDMKDDHIINSLRVLKRNAINTVLLGKLDKDDGVVRRYNGTRNSVSHILSRTRYYYLLDYAKLRGLNVAEYDIARPTR